jgi:hypothetical protein
VPLLDVWLHPPPRKAALGSPLTDATGRLDQLRPNRCTDSFA